MRRMSKVLRRLTLRAARLAPAGALVGFVFQHCAAALPIRYLRRTGSFVAFAHPVPVSRGHILVIPRLRMASPLQFLGSSTRCDEFLELACGLIEDSPPGHFAISTNVGRRQEVKQVHFHLVPGASPILRSDLMPRATARLAALEVREIPSADGALTSLELWLDPGAAREELANVAAQMIEVLGPRIECFPGATIFLIASARPEIELRPGVRIVLENPKGLHVLDDLVAGA